MPLSNELSNNNINLAISNVLALLRQGLFHLAKEQALAILTAVPDEPNSLFALAVVMRAEGDNQGALQGLKQLLIKHENFALAQQELGYTLAALGHFLPAIAALQKAVALDAKLPGAWCMMGELFLADEDESSAAEAFRQHLLASTNNPELVRAVTLFSQGQLGQAEKLCRHILKAEPTEVNAIRLLAEIGMKVGVYTDVEHLLQRCLELKPDYHLARLNYAQLLSKIEKLDLALIEVDKLLSLEANKPTLLVLRASILAKLGNFDSAIACYETLINKIPPRAKIALSYGHALKAVGRQAEAIAAYRSAISVEPSFGDAYWSLANLKTFRFNDEDICAMLELLGLPSCQQEDKFHVYFALGKAYEHRSDYAQSFHYYQHGNQLKNRIERYSADENSRNIERMMHVCSASLFEKNIHSGASNADPIFIVGLPRSGSTLLEQMLASHTQVDGTKELVQLLAMVQKLGGRRKLADVSNYPEILEQLNPEQLHQLGQEYLNKTQQQRAGADFFIDKMPNNFLHIGFIHLILPNAKIIDARRHPIAACFSGYTQLFAKGQNFSYNLADIARYYHDYATLMDHWDKVLPGKVLRVHYEQVVTDTETMLRRILDFCGLSFEQNCLQFYQTDRAIRTASSEQVRQPIYQSGLDHWRHYAPYLDKLNHHLGPLIDLYPVKLS